MPSEKPEEETMQIKLHELNQALQRGLSTLYLITGDEPLLTEQAQAQIRAMCKQQGFSHRDVFTIQNSAGWDELFSLYASSDLFAQKKILDIRNPSNKFDNKAQKFIEQVNQSPNPNITLLITSAKLTAAQKRTKWLKKIDQIGVIINIWPIASHELPKWISNTLKQQGLKASHESIQLLAQLTEGNLLATQQSITKLKLLFPNQPIDCEHVIKAAHDTARFSVFDLANYALLGHLEKTTRALHYLQQSGAEPTLVLWSLAREIRLLHALVHADTNSGNTQAILKSEWQSRQRLLSNAAKRFNLQDITGLLHHANRTDKIIKGNITGSSWRALSELATGMCGLSLTVCDTAL